MACDNNSRGGAKTGPGSYPLLMTIEEENAASVNSDWGTADLTEATSWTQHGRIYAKAVTNGGKEFYNQVQQYAETTHVWRAKSTSTARAATALMRITWSGRIFQIISVVDVDEMRDTVLISTKETIPTGSGI